MLVATGFVCKKILIIRSEIKTNRLSEHSVSAEPSNFVILSISLNLFDKKYFSKI